MGMPTIQGPDNWITPHVNFFQYAPNNCENEMGKAGKRKDMVEDRLCERAVCDNVACKRVVCDVVVCVNVLCVMQELCVMDCDGRVVCVTEL